VVTRLGSSTANSLGLSLTTMASSVAATTLPSKGWGSMAKPSVEDCG
jgi:hypothetical protein